MQAHTYGVAIALLICGAAKALAADDVMVDPKNGNLIGRWTDLKIEAPGGAPIIRRTYNSVSDHHGVFGRDWCSSFETSVALTPGGELIYRSCGAGSKVVFRPTPDGTLLATGPLGGRAVQAPTGWVIHRAGNSQEEFDSLGRIAAVRTVDGNAHFIEWRADGRGPARLRYTSGWDVTFLYGDIGGPSELQVQRGGKPYPNSVHYSYSAEGHLVEVKVTDWSSQYEYCGTPSKLCKIAAGTEVTTTATYIPGTGRAATMTQGACPETFQYPASPGRAFEVTRRHDCDQTDHYRYQYSATSPALLHSRDQSQDRVVEVDYQPNLQVPEKVRIGNPGGSKIIETHDFDSKGRLTKVVRAGMKTEYMYDEACNKLRSVSERVGTTRYTYDKRCLLTAIQGPGGDMSLTYNQQAQIATITKNGKTVSVSYEPHFGKPSRLVSEDKGEVIVTYKANGEIDKVSSGTGPTTAVHVASIFNSLMDAFKPDEDVDKQLCAHNALWVKCGEGTDRPLFLDRATP